MATLISSRQIEPGVFQETWEEDARIYHCFRDESERERNDLRSKLRDLHDKHRGDGFMRPMGYIAPFERQLLELKDPALKSKDRDENYRAWKRFWQSSASEKYRTTQQV